MTLSTLFAWSLPFLFLVLAGILVRRHLLKKAREKESEKIRVLQDKIQAALEDSAVSFDASLQESLRRTREPVRPGKPDRLVRADPAKDAPEKYRILTNMAARGMSAEEIATILGISTTEAGQLVTLSNLAGWNN